jgi:hypothetical protein
LKHLIRGILLSQNHYFKRPGILSRAGGLTNYVQNFESIRYRCNSTTKIRREFVTGSLEVYPIKNYGILKFGDIVSIIRQLAKKRN